MYQSMYEDLARAHQNQLLHEAEQSRAGRRQSRLARAERTARRAQAAHDRARRRVVALSA
jgi:hypothetical protein